MSDAGELILLDESEAKEFPVQTSSHIFNLEVSSGAGEASEAELSVVVTKFANKTQILILDSCVKATVLYEVKKDRSTAESKGNEEKQVFSVNVLFGTATEELDVLARLLGQVNPSEKNLIVGLGFREAASKSSLSHPKAVRKLVDFVKSVLWKKTMSTVIFGQVVIGPPGSGKTTYCEAMSRFLKAIGRDVAIVNIDPANEGVPYVADVDVGDLIKLEDVMAHFKLGPNGGLVYCMEYLEKNVDWLIQKLNGLRGKYVIIDCPGQVELYTHDHSVRNILSALEKFGTRLCAVNLVDAHYCSDPSKYISVCLTSLNTMMRIELPHVNVLSKADLIQKYGKLDFGIDYYTEVLDLNYLVDRMPNDPFTAKHKKLTEAITGLVQDSGLVSFLPLSVDSKEQMLAVKNNVDKANGYCFGSKTEERHLNAMMSSAYGVTDFEYAKTSEVREKYLDEKPPNEDDDNDSDKRMDDADPEFEEITNDLDKVDIGPGFQV